MVEDSIFGGFQFPQGNQERNCDIHTVIDENDEDIQPLSLKTHQQLKLWQNLLDALKDKGKDIPSFPIWAMEFGANYPFEDKAPFAQPLTALQRCRGKLGDIVEGIGMEECLSQLPIYAQTKTSEVFPGWKIRYIQQNRQFWKENHVWLKSWRKSIVGWDNSHQKFEWNCKGNDNYKIKDKIVQFRASGIRVKLPTFSPALNLIGTQIPILPWIKLPEKCIPPYSDEELEEFGLTRQDVQYGRYLSTKEAAKLQGMDKLSFGNLSRTRIYEALGNAVNTQVVKKIVEILIHTYGNS